MEKRILIVEDEQAMLHALQEAFILHGIPTLIAMDGREGLSVALAEHPEIILLDLLMPVMDGFTMLEELRKDAWGKGVKVMVLTNFSNDDVRRRVAPHNICEFIVKADCGIDEVVAKVETALA